MIQSLLPISHHSTLPHHHQYSLNTSPPNYHASTLHLTLHHYNQHTIPHHQPTLSPLHHHPSPPSLHLYHPSFSICPLNTTTTHYDPFLTTTPGAQLWRAVCSASTGTTSTAWAATTATWTFGAARTWRCPSG